MSGKKSTEVADLLQQGWAARELTNNRLDDAIRKYAESILKNNLFGLDIDDRAYQLAYFAVLMKARKYNRRILDKNITPLVYSIQESNGLSSEFINHVIAANNDIKDDLFAEKLGRISIKELSRTARDRRAGSLGYSEAMLLAYNKKSQKPLKFEQLYSNKGAKPQNAITKEELAVQNAEDEPGGQMDLSQYDM